MTPPPSDRWRVTWRDTILPLLTGTSDPPPFPGTGDAGQSRRVGRCRGACTCCLRGGVSNVRHER